LHVALRRIGIIKLIKLKRKRSIQHWFQSYYDSQDESGKKALEISRHVTKHFVTSTVTVCQFLLIFVTLLFHR
jgi:hypothetical protein